MHNVVILNLNSSATLASVTLEIYLWPMRIESVSEVKVALISNSVKIERSNNILSVNNRKVQPVFLERGSFDQKESF